MNSSSRVSLTVFTSIENRTYVTIALSAGVILFMIATARGHLLGKVEVCSATGDGLYGVDNSSGRGSRVTLYNAPGELVIS